MVIIFWLVISTFNFNFLIWPIQQTKSTEVTVLLAIGGMRQTSTALYFYRASKKNVHKSTANFWINLILYGKYSNNNM